MIAFRKKTSLRKMQKHFDFDYLQDNFYKDILKKYGNTKFTKLFAILIGNIFNDLNIIELLGQYYDNPDDISSDDYVEREYKKIHLVKLSCGKRLNRHKLKCFGFLRDNVFFDVMFDGHKQYDAIMKKYGKFLDCPDYEMVGNYLCKKTGIIDSNTRDYLSRLRPLN